MHKKKTHDEYVEELKIKNPTIEVIEKYIDANTKIEHHCLAHDVYWWTTPSRALQGVGCKVCHKERLYESKCRTTEQYNKQVHAISPHIDVVDKFISIRTPILHKCNIHNITWLAYPEGILKGCGCCECGNEKIRNKKTKSYDEYIVQLKELNPNIICIGEYKNSTTKVLHRCLLDDFEWEAVPSQILAGRGCPKCSESHGERTIALWLENNNITYSRQKIFDGCKDKKYLPFDFYLTDYNIAIEYDGEQHYRPVAFFGGIDGFNIRKRHDKIKTTYCADNDIRLLRVPFYLENIDEVLNNFLFI